MHPISKHSNHHLLPLAVYTFFRLEYLVKHGMCLLELDSHLKTMDIEWYKGKILFCYRTLSWLRSRGTGYSSVCIYVKNIHEVQ